MEPESLGGMPDTEDLIEIVPEVEAARCEDETPPVPDVEQIRAEAQEALGVVPAFLRAAEHDPRLLAAQWQLARRFTLEHTHIPAKYRDLIGLAVASATHCRYCATYHRGLAHAHGATEEELNEAVALAQYTAGLSAYADGLLLSSEDAAEEADRIEEHLRP